MNLWLGACEWYVRIVLEVTTKHLLVVEDEEDIQELVRYNLERDGYAVTTVASGEDALEKAAATPPDLILLDLMLPGLNGLDVCRALRAEQSTKKIPIIMLTARSEESDIVAGLELGADDYVTKPFSPRILLARVRAVLRRRASGPTENDSPIALGGILIDPVRHEVKVENEQVQLSSTEFRILQILLSAPGRVYTRDQIIDAVHGADYAVTDRSVDVQVVGLRRKLGESGRLIETVRNVGYKFKDAR